MVGNLFDELAQNPDPAVWINKARNLVRSLPDDFNTFIMLGESINVALNALKDPTTTRQEQQNRLTYLHSLFACLAMATLSFNNHNPLFSSKENAQTVAKNEFYKIGMAISRNNNNFAAEDHFGHGVLSKADTILQTLLNTGKSNLALEERALETMQFALLTFDTFSNGSTTHYSMPLDVRLGLGRFSTSKPESPKAVAAVKYLKEFPRLIPMN